MIHHRQRLPLGFEAGDNLPRVHAGFDDFQGDAAFDRLGLRGDVDFAYELAVDALWNDVWEKELVAQALDKVCQESGSSMTFRAFEQYVLLDRPAERVAEELGMSTATVYQAKTRITRQLREALARAREIAD